MVVPPALKRGAWVGAAVVAAAVIIALAFHGRRPDPGLARFEAAGVMLHMPPERITEVVVSRDGRSWRFTRGDTYGWTPAPGTPALRDDMAARIESGLRFLHASAPQRVMARETLAGTPLAEMGLDPPHYAVSASASGAPPLTVEFGALNAQGLAQYARVGGRDEILLLPGFVGEPWDALTRAPARLN